MDATCGGCSVRPWGRGCGDGGGAEGGGFVHFDGAPWVLVRHSACGGRAATGAAPGLVPRDLPACSFAVIPGGVWRHLVVCFERSAVLLRCPGTVIQRPELHVLRTHRCGDSPGVTGRSRDVTGVTGDHRHLPFPVTSLVINVTFKNK